MDVKGWDVDVVPDDFHHFIKCFFKKGGHFRLVPIFMLTGNNAQEHTNWFSAMRSRYRRAKRDAWGAIDLSYILSQWYQKRKYWINTTHLCSFRGRHRTPHLMVVIFLNRYARGYDVGVVESRVGDVSIRDRYSGHGVDFIRSNFVRHIGRISSATFTSECFSCKIENILRRIRLHCGGKFLVKCNGCSCLWPISFLPRWRRWTRSCTWRYGQKWPVPCLENGRQK